MKISFWFRDWHVDQFLVLIRITLDVNSDFDLPFNVFSFPWFVGGGVRGVDISQQDNQILLFCSCSVNEFFCSVHVMVMIITKKQWK